MVAIKSMDLRNNFREMCDKINAGETLLIARPKNENIVLISEAEYNEMLKAKRNADYIAMLEKSVAEMQSGKYQEHDLTEVD